MLKFFVLSFILHVLASVNAETHGYSHNHSSKSCSITWKPYHHDKAPSIDGFKMGKNKNNYDVYVGKGTYNGQTGPGNIQIEGNTGFYYPYGGSERHILHDIYYLSVIGDCNCEFVPQPISQTTPGLITVKDRSENDHLFYIGRYTFPGTSYSTVGEIVVKFNAMHYAENGQEKSIRNFDALACIANKNDYQIDYLVT